MDDPRSGTTRPCLKGSCRCVGWSLMGLVSRPATATPTLTLSCWAFELLVAGTTAFSAIVGEPAVHRITDSLGVPPPAKADTVRRITASPSATNSTIVASLVESRHLHVPVGCRSNLPLWPGMRDVHRP